MTNSYILSTSKNYIGSIASSVSGEEPSLFRNLYSEAIVEGRKTDGTAIDCIGGILGGCYYGVAEMQSVVFNGTVSGSAGVGGIVGNVNSLATDENSPSSELTLSDCANYGEILATSNHNGGLVGLNRGHLTLNRCYNARTVPSTDGFSGSLVYLECNSRTEQARISIADTYYLTGTNANALIAWHNYYALTVTYDGVQTGSAAIIYQSDGLYRGTTANDEYYGTTTNYFSDEVFYNGRCMLEFGLLESAKTFATDVTLHYGILPLPKLNSGQEGYATTPQDAYSIVSMPYNIGADLGLATATLEVMSEYSYRDVRPVYHELAYKVRYASSDITGELFDMIIDSIAYDFGSLYGASIEDPLHKIRNMLAGYNQAASANLGSIYRVFGGTIEEKLDDLLADFDQQKQ